MIKLIGNSAELLATWTFFDRSARLVKSTLKLHLLSFPDVVETAVGAIPGYVEPLRNTIHKFAVLDIVDFGINSYRLPGKITTFREKVKNDGLKAAVNEGLDVVATSLLLTDDATTTWTALSRLGYVTLPALVSRIGSYVAPVLLLYAGIKTGVTTYTLFKEMRVKAEARKNYVELKDLLKEQGGLSKFERAFEGRNIQFLKTFINNPEDKTPIEKFMQSVQRKTENATLDNEMKQFLVVVEKLKNSTTNLTQSDAAFAREQKLAKREIVINTMSSVANIALGVILAVNLVNPVSATVINSAGLVKSVAGFTKVFADRYRIGIPGLTVEAPSIDGHVLEV